MTSSRCELSWMADAVDDGRLDDEARAGFQDHASSCAACLGAIREATRLREWLGRLPEPTVSEFRHRGMRQRIIAHAAGLKQTETTSPSRAWRPIAFALALIVVVGAVGARAFWNHLGWRATMALSIPPRYEITELAEATWSHEEAGAIARVKLSQGSLVFHVHRLGVGQRFLVSLPDGEIEVRGTRFVVNVEGGLTRYIVVMEGKVEFRQRGVSERVLIGGQRWDVPAPQMEETAGRAASRAESERLRVAREAPGSVTVGTRPPSLHFPVTKAAGTRHHRRPGASLAVVAPPTNPDQMTGMGTPAQDARNAGMGEGGEEKEAPVRAEDAARTANSASSNGGDAAGLFARGMAAFRAGRHAEADRIWQAFLSGHPGDPRDEDIAFLRAVARSRAGDLNGAATLARAYLERFPHGLRRHEAEALARRAP